MSEHDNVPLTEGLEFGDENIVDGKLVDTPQRDPEIDAEARKYGWKPKEEFTLAPEGWKDADQFLDLTSIKYRREKDIRKERDAEVASLREQMGRIAAMTERQLNAKLAEERATYDQRIAELQRAKQEAVETADVDRFKAVEAQERQLRPPAPPPVAPQDDHLNGVEWVKDNELRNLGAAMIDAQPHIRVLPPKDQVRWAEQQLRAVYPDRFTPAAQQPPQGQQHTASKVDGGGLAGGGTRAKGVADLPSDARIAGRDFVARGIFKSLEDYARDYHAQG